MKNYKQSATQLFISSRARKIMLICLLLSIFLTIVFNSYVLYQNRTFSDEYIEDLFASIKAKYGIQIVYKVGDDFLSGLSNSIIPAGPARNSEVTPIRHSVLVRYPSILQRSLEKYPIAVVKRYLFGVYFAGKIKDGRFNYGGSYDPFRRIVFLVDNGNQTESHSIYAFHHEFCSLLLLRHSFLLNPWLDQNPKGFTYLYDTEKDQIEIYAATSLDGTEADYEKGFMNSYGQTDFENDINEYSAMIFTYPQKFKKIMERYPRVRGKFLVWLKFYNNIDPIFTEDYFFEK